MKNSAALSYFCMALGWLLWSMDPILLHMAGDGISRAVMAGTTLLMAGIMLFVPACKGYVFIAKHKELWWYFAGYVILATVLADLAYVMAIRNLHPGLVSMILRSQIVLVPLTASFILKEKINKSTIVGMVIVVLGYIGIALFTGKNIPSDEGRNIPLGWTFAVIAALLWTFGTIFGKKLMHVMNSSQLCGMRMLTAGIIINVVFICIGGTSDYTAVTSHQWMVLVIKTIFCSALAYAVYMRGLQLASATAAAAMEQAAPLFTLVVAQFILHESVASAQWIGIAIVFFGASIILVNQYKAIKNKQ